VERDQVDEENITTPARDLKKRTLSEKTYDYGKKSEKL
jgi:hypothetical protein